ncbi:MAG: hypothetical protein AABX48_00130 [Nanoarchaeota archaeon]
MVESLVLDTKGLAEFNFDMCRSTYLLNPQAHGSLNWEKLSYPKASELASSHGLKIIYGKERDEDENYKIYRNKFDNQKLDSLEGRFIAYQDQQIVGVSLKKDLGTLLKKMKGLLKKDPILIVHVGKGYGMYSKK